MKIKHIFSLSTKGLTVGDTLTVDDIEFEVIGREGWFWNRKFKIKITKNVRKT